MFSIVIADDEPWIVYGMKNLINWENVGFEIVGEAYNGAQAMEQIRTKTPHAVITDIRMPGLNGIELMRTVRQEGMNTEFIVVSGYAEFEYAQQALKLGAFDYLLKQVSGHALRDTLSKLFRHLKSRTEIEETELGFSFLEDVIESLDKGLDCKALQLFIKNGMVCRHPDYRIINVFSEKHIDFSDVLLDGASLEYKKLRSGRKKQTCLVNYDEKLISLPETIFTKTQNYTDISVGLSKNGKHEDNARALYREADISLYTALFYHEKTVIPFDEKPFPFDELNRRLSGIHLAARESNLEKMSEYLRELAVFFCNERAGIDVLAHTVSRVASMLDTKNTPSRRQDMQNIDFYQLYHQCRDIDAVFDTLYMLAAEKRFVKAHVTSDLFKKILDYVDENYKTDIQLSDVAKKFSISTSYLSAKFKKEVSITFSQYVAQKRIEAAKLMLCEDTISLDEIVHSIGYKDYFHFIKLFKKNTGVTPSNFRKINR